MTVKSIWAGCGGIGDCSQSVSSSRRQALVKGWKEAEEMLEEVEMRGRIQRHVVESKREI